jgi:hypothetical protein
MDKKWAELLLRAAQRADEADEREFARLVKDVEAQCDADAARVLMKTFSGREDFATQELVSSALASCSPRDFVSALLEELPRLTAECPEWAHILVSDAIRADANELIEGAKSAPPEARECLRKVLVDNKFFELAKRAETVRAQVFGA